MVSNFLFSNSNSLKFLKINY